MVERMAKRRVSAVTKTGRGLRVPGYLLLHALLFFGVVLGIMRGWEYLQHPQSFPILNVVIEGDIRHQSRAELTEVMTPLVTGGFFALDLEHLEQALSALPWVYAATVRRIWPDQVVVHITEEIAVAYWGDDGLLTQYGYIIKPPVATFPSGLPHLQGNEGRHQLLMNRYLSVQAMLADIEIEVTGIYEDARRAWRIESADGMQVMMGRRVELATIERLVRMYPHISAHRDAPIARIDLRYTNGAAVAWKTPVTLGAN